MTTILGNAYIRVRPDTTGFGASLSTGVTGPIKNMAGIIAGSLAGLGIAKVVSDIGKIGMTYQDTMNNLQAVSGATAKQMADVGKTAKQLGSDTSLTATSAADAAEAMTELAKGGLSVDSAMKAAKGTLQLAAAAGISASEAATIQSSALNAYSLDASQAGHVSDVLANAANAAAGEIGDFALGMSQASAVAASTGISLEDTAATLGILANNGIKGSDAGTLLKSALLALQSPSKPAKAAMDALSLSAYDAHGKFVGLSSIFGQLSKASKTMTDEQYAAATSTLFGSDAARLAGVAAKEGSAGFDKMADAMNKSGSAADVATAKSKGVHGAIEALKSSLETVQINIFEKVAPAVEKTLRRVGDAFTVLTTQVPNLWGAFKDADAQGVGEVLDNIFGNTGKYVGDFRTLGQAIIDFWSGITLKDPKSIGAPLEGMVKLGHDARDVISEVWNSFKNVKDIAVELGPIVGIALGGGFKLAWEAVKLLAPVLESVTGYLAEHKTAVYLLVGALAAWKLIMLANEGILAVQAAGSMVNWLKQTKLIMGVTKAWTAIQTVFNAVMALNPLVLIGIALAALVAGFILAYQHSETFRDIVQGALHAVADAGKWMWEKVLKPVWDALVSAWDWVSGAVMDGWHGIQTAWQAMQDAANWLWKNVLQPVFNGIADGWNGLVTGIKWYWEHILSPVFTIIQDVAKILLAVLVVAIFGPILLAWEGMTKGIAWAWEHLLKPAWDAVSDAATWLWDKILKPYFTFIVDGWTWLATTIFNVYKTILQAAWDAVSTAAQWMWDHVLKPVFGFIQAGWTDLVNGIKWAYDNILQPAWNALQTAADWLWNHVLSPTFQAIQDAWDKVLRAMVWVWDNILHPMFNAFSDAAGKLRDAFGTAVDAIGTAWDKIREYAAKPINFVIDTVLNKGLFAAFNWVVDKLGLDKKWHLDNLATVKLASGGRVPGSSAHDRADNIPAMLTANEFVQPVAAHRYYGTDVMEAIRTRAIPKEAFQRLADGGPVYQQLFNRVKQQFPDARMNDGYRPGASDLHGAGKAVDLGKQGQAGGNGTPFLASMNQWLYDNFKGSILELIYDGAGDNRPDIKNGANHAYSSALQAQHRNHVHLASNGLGAGLGIDGGGGGGLLGGIWDSVTGVFNHIKDSISSPIKSLFDSFGHTELTDTVSGTVTQLPGKMWDAVKDKVTGMASSIWNGAQDLASSGWDAVSGAAGSVWDFITGGDNDDVKGTVKKIAAAKGWDSGAQWNGLDYVVSHESGWNPKAKNGSSTASGLGQFINATWMAYRGSSSATKMMDASVADQGKALMKYIQARYTDPIGASNFWKANHHYANGTKLAARGVAMVGERGPELVSFRGGESVLTAQSTRNATATESPLVGELHVHVGDGATVKDGLEETLFQLRRLKRGSNT